MSKPWIEILNEPDEANHRFRYKSEDRCSGHIKGGKSDVPKIKIHGMGSDAIVFVSCVTADEPYYPHPHSLVGNGCEEDNHGICIIRATDGNNIVRLQKVGIRCCKRQGIQEALRRREQTQIDPFGTGFNYDYSKIDLNRVRLCFQVHLVDANQQTTTVVDPVVTKEIFNQRSYKSLEIRRLSRSSAPARGGTEVFILCDKVNKNDIGIRFFATLNDGTEWEGYGEFSPLDVHAQSAVVCKTPALPLETLLAPVVGNIQLVQPSTGLTGSPLPFQFTQSSEDIREANAKRRKIPSRLDPVHQISTVEAEKQSEGGIGGLAEIVGMNPSFSESPTIPSASLPAVPPSENFYPIKSVVIDALSSGTTLSANQAQESHRERNLLTNGTKNSVRCDVGCFGVTSSTVEPHLENGYFGNLATTDVDFNANLLSSLNEVAESNLLEQILSEIYESLGENLLLGAQFS